MNNELLDAIVKALKGMQEQITQNNQGILHMLKALEKINEKLEQKEKK